VSGRRHRGPGHLERDRSSDQGDRVYPSRVLLQDFTGVPAVVDLAAMRDAMNRLGGDPTRINPLCPAELVIDHSVQVDDFGSNLSFLNNANLEFVRNSERYAFLRWGQKAFWNFRVVPPDTGIVHQVTSSTWPGLCTRGRRRSPGTARLPRHVGRHDSHTTMINGSASLAGASAALRRRRPCSASRCRC